MKKLHKISLVFLSSLITLTAQALPAYQFVDLGGLAAGQNSGAYGVNNANQVVGYAYDQSGVQTAVTWQGGTVQSLGFSGIARAINNNNEIVGDKFFTGSTTGGRAFHLQNNQLTQLGNFRTDNTGESSALDINDAGKIVGLADTQYSYTAPAQRGFVVHRNTTNDFSMTDLGVVNPAYPDGYTRAHGINDVGQIVGRGSETTFNGGFKHSVYWDANLTIDLSYPTDKTNARYGVSEDINNNGIAVAVERFGTQVGKNRTYLWDVNTDTFQYLTTLSGYTNSYGTALNDAGMVVGYADMGSIGVGFTPDYENDSPVAFLYSTDTGMLDLNSLIVGQMAAEGWVSNVAYDINAQGSIVGMGTFNGETRAFMLQAAPEVPLPAASWLFISAIAGLFVRKKF
jgi:hypothetical protein